MDNRFSIIMSSGFVYEVTREVLDEILTKIHMIDWIRFTDADGKKCAIRTAEIEGYIELT